MAQFDRFDICGAHRALENDWNNGGWLQSRPSNVRRRESTGVQLHRMGCKPAGDACTSFDYLENDNQREIYCRALVAYGMASMLSPDDETHEDIIAWLADRFGDTRWYVEHFPQLSYAAHVARRRGYGFVPITRAEWDAWNKS